jgi:hypothetical protein
MNPAKRVITLLVWATSLCFIGPRNKDHWIKLFNGKDLKGWNTYLGPDLDDLGKPKDGKPIGLNNDPRHVFTVVSEEDENIIRISGENWGAITTINEYKNYHLHLEFRWGSLSWGQKKHKKKDSGLLYHSVGPFGADYGAWMRSQEFQIEEGNCGDYWGVAGGIADIPAFKKTDTGYYYNPAGQITTFREGSPEGRWCKKGIDAENPSGEWNSLDLYCHGDTSIHVINGRLMMILYQEKQLENGQVIPLTGGKIQIQSEGAEVFYKDIKIRPIARLPLTGNGTAGLLVTEE